MKEGSRPKSVSQKDLRDRTLNNGAVGAFTDMDPNTLPKSAVQSASAFFFHMVKAQKWRLAFYQLLCVLRSLEGLIYAIPTRMFINVLEKGGSKETLAHDIKRPIIFMVLAWLVIDVLYRASSIVRSRMIRPQLEYSSTRKVTNFLMTQPFSFFMQHPSSINNRMIQLTEGFYDFTLSLIELVIPAIMSSVVIAFSVFVISPQIGLIVLAYSTAHITLIAINLKKYSRMSRVNALSHNILIRSSLNTIKNMPTVKSFSQESFESERLNIFHKRRRTANTLSFSAPEKLRIFLAINSFLFLGVWLVIVAANLFIQNTLNIGDISFALTNSFSSTQLLYAATNELIKIMEDIGRCSEGILFLKKHSEHAEKRVPDVNPAKFDCSQGIQFKNVSLSYPGSKSISFKNQTISISPGERIGVVGISGAGKTTFVNLIMGYFLPTKGSVLICGNDTSKVDLSQLRKNITVIPQNYGLFDRTILENISYSRPDASYKKIIAASKKANVHNFISSLKHGYYTSVHDGGSNLSGGQKQRVAIARAILSDGSILILDEATSAMDNHTQSLIQASMEELMNNKTTIIIAHKLQTIKDVDRILVFKGGRVIEQGPHKTLIKNRDGYYRYLWDLQENYGYSFE